eukprot:577383_1
MGRVYLLFMAISGIRSVKSASGDCGEHARHAIWWDSTNEEAFCLCQSGTEVCSQTYAEILSNSALKDALLSECSGYLKGDCATNSSTWVKGHISLINDCPECACDTVGEVSYVTKRDEKFVTKYNDCYEGTCMSLGGISYIRWDNTPVYTLDDDELKTKSWTCPPSTCDYNGETKYLDQNWWVDIEDDPTCQSFCVCKSDGTVSCSTSYAGIVEDDALIDAFNEECGWIYEDWFDEEGSCISSETDVSAWVSTTSWGGRCDCPQVDTVECDPDQAFQHKVSYLNVFCFVILSYFWFV